MSRPRTDLFAPKPALRLRIDACEVHDEAYASRLKTSPTNPDVKVHLAQHTRTAGGRLEEHIGYLAPQKS